MSKLMNAIITVIVRHENCTVEEAEEVIQKQIEDLYSESID